MNIDAKTHEHHFILIRMTVIKKRINNVSEDVEKLEPLCIAGENIKWLNY